MDEINEENENEIKTVSSIDIGFDNLSVVTYDTILSEFTDCRKLSIRDNIFECSDSNCTLGHTKSFTDRINHLTKDHSKLFDSDKILIEKQPPGFGQIIEELLYSKFRDKAEKQSPSSMHAYFGIGDLDYDLRKESTVKIAHAHIKDFPDYINNERKHDMADATCFLLYFLEKQKTIRREHEIQMSIRKNNQDFLDNGGLSFRKAISKFVYRPE
jgi:hypothetical protein